MRLRAWIAALLIAALCGCLALLSQVEDAPRRGGALAVAHDSALTTDQLRRALLHPDAFGGEFREQLSVADLKKIGPGCLEVFDSVHRISFPRQELGVTLSPSNRADRQSFYQSIATFFSEAEAAAAVRAIRQRTETCTGVQTSTELPTFDLRLRHDRRRSSPVIAEQVTVLARGTVGLSGRRVALVVGLSAFRVGSNVVLAAAYDPSGAARETIDLIDRVAAERLAAVIAGDAVPEGAPLAVLRHGGPTTAI